MVSDLASTIKNIWFIGGTAIASVTGLLAYIQAHSVEIAKYASELFVGLFFVLFLSGLYAYYKTHTRITAAENKTIDSLAEIKESMEAESLDRKTVQLEADIERFFYVHIKFSSLRLGQVQRLHNLEKRRKELGLNSFSEYQMTQLFKIPTEDKYRN